MDNPLIRIDPGLFIWSIVSFLVLLGVLAKFVWKPLNEALDRRERRIRKSLEEAEQARKEMEKLHQKSEEIITKARGEAHSIVTESKAAAGRMKDELFRDAKEKANSILSDAEKQIQVEKDKAIQKVKKEVVDIALQVASKLIKKNLTKKDNQSIIEDSLKKIESYEA
ncbi:MAG: F0F1 ATP synthase subunit B [Candidatus Marinimicrobia bacterium]|nr:F0F1 ATP synthase subunit B [Candidatus Neomarinimicrobiota bacterium]